MSLLEQALAEHNKDLPLKERKDIPKGGMDGFLNGIVRNFLQEQIKQFPALCEETRQINLMHLKEMAQVGNKTPTRMIGGKVYEGSTGWSRDFSMKHKWIIPTKLKFFMRNLIYVDFWDDENAKVRDNFMKGLLRGDDPLEILKKVRGHYGSDAQELSIR